MVEVPFTIFDGDRYACGGCDWTGSKSGFYKHRQKHLSPEGDKTESSSASAPVPASPPAPSTYSTDDEDYTEESDDGEPVPVEDTTPPWMDWSGSDEEDSSSPTHHLPSPLKGLTKKTGKSKRSKRSEKELASARSTSKSIINLGLTMTDTVLTTIGRASTLDPDYRVEHSQKDKDLTSDAVVVAMEEKGLYLSDRLNSTVVATALVAWYVGVPAYDISKKAKKSPFGKGKGLLKRLPLIGRLFRRKQTGPPIAEAVR